MAEYSVRTAVSGAQVEELREPWTRMQGHPNSDIDFYLHVINSLENVIRPHVLVAYVDGKPEGILVGRVERRQMPLQVGYKDFGKISLRCLTFVYGGHLGDQSKVICATLLSEIQSLLNRHEIDAVYFNSLRADSEMVQLAASSPGFFCRDHAYLSSANLHWSMTVPSSMDDFFGRMTRKRRHLLRPLVRALEKAYPGQVRFREYRTLQDIAELCSDAEQVAQTTYQRGLGVGFVDSVEMRLRLALLAGKGRLRAYVLRIGDRPYAFWMGTIYNGIFYPDFTSYDPALRKYELGTIVFMRMIEDLVADGIKTVDFGFGDAFYKERFGDQSWKEVSLYIFAPTVKGITCNFLRTVTSVISRFGKTVLARTRHGSGR